jgi:hypothetical protein
VTRLKLYLAAAVAVVATIFAALFRARKTGEKIATADMKEKDHVQADKVRDRVARVDRTSGVRPDDERGWRD